MRALMYIIKKILLFYLKNIFHIHNKFGILSHGRTSLVTSVFLLLKIKQNLKKKQRTFHNLLGKPEASMLSSG